MPFLDPLIFGLADEIEEKAEWRPRRSGLYMSVKTCVSEPEGGEAVKAPGDMQPQTDTLKTMVPLNG
jgi:hypothetical protein